MKSTDDIKPVPTADDESKVVDEVITPTSTHTKEQAAEELKRKTDEIERKVADSN